MVERREHQAADDTFWRRAFFSERTVNRPLKRVKHDVTAKHKDKIGDAGELWLSQLFEGKQLSQTDNQDKLTVYKNGQVVYDIGLDELTKETVIGRHPDVDLQLESHKLAMFHAVIYDRDGKYFIESLDQENGVLFDRKKIKYKKPIRLYDGMQLDLPGFRLQFSIKDSPLQQETIETEELAEIPSFFYTPPAPPARPVLSNLIEEHASTGLWEGGETQLTVADIIDETHDCKTFRLVGSDPLLFSYKPGQFITFVLDINGRQIKRSYSMSSSPSRPHILEVTIKRVPGGLVSNWFCDQVKLGDQLTVKGPKGKFTCFNFPSAKMLFIGAGSGVTPIFSMRRWITDTAAAVDVKMLASFRNPADIIFAKELDSLSARSSGFQMAVTLTSSATDMDDWNGFKGRVDRAMLVSFVPDLLDRDIFMCGPGAFTDAVKQILYEIGFDMSRFHMESFDSGRSSENLKVGTRTLDLQGALHKVKFTRSGLTVETDEHTNLLTLAEAHGIDMDYSCRVGSCGECEVKCKGQVDVDDNCEIDEKTRQAGFIYSCCCTAKSDLELDI